MAKLGGWHEPTLWSLAGLTREVMSNSTTQVLRRGPASEAAAEALLLRLRSLGVTYVQLTILYVYSLLTM